MDERILPAEKALGRSAWSSGVYKNGDLAQPTWQGTSEEGGEPLRAS